MGGRNIYTPGYNVRGGLCIYAIAANCHIIFSTSNSAKKSPYLIEYSTIKQGKEYFSKLAGPKSHRSWQLWSTLRNFRISFSFWFVKHILFNTYLHLIFIFLSFYVIILFSIVVIVVIVEVMIMIKIILRQIALKS